MFVEWVMMSKGWRYAYEAATSRAKDAYALLKCVKEVCGFMFEGFK